MSNHLAKETSPYLLQHSQNPVDWYPWGEEAFQRAKAEDKPILLSIGYSACHWCHVMAHESFENIEISGQMNENFINVKVDREERPDVDHIYMESVQAMVGSGGWPLTVFLTPERKPFFGGTYFPPEDRRGMPGFPRVLRMVAEAYKHKSDSVKQATSQITDYLVRVNNLTERTGPLTRNIMDQAFSSLESCFDERSGGFGSAPKFPNPLTLEFLLRYYAGSGEKRALAMVEITLEKMAAGGIYDQVGGGFHRYATDGAWQIPHFEKMLYDNALLTQTYIHAYQITGKTTWSEIAQETIGYLLREMRDTDGGFYCSQDADTEGEEGKYYLWTAQEMEEVLGRDLFSQVKDYWGITGGGNFEGRNILHRTDSPEAPAFVQNALALLVRRREKRTKPSRDEKVLASWNGLTLSALIEASVILRRPDFQAAAIANGEFLLDNMIKPDGRLMHSYKDGQVRINGFLDDYASVIDGFLSLHQITLETKWLESAIDLTQKMIQHFYDAETGILYDTANDQKDLLVRPRNDFDGAVPSGGANAALVLLKMGEVTGNASYQEIAARAITAVANNACQTPMGYSQWLCALDFFLSSPPVVVIVGDRRNLNTQDLKDVVYKQWMPNKIVVSRNPAQPDSLQNLALFKERFMLDNKPTVYVCQKNTCKTPATSAEELERSLY
jgi:uncharacterized protein